MASHSSTGGKGKVNQVSTNVSVARELNPGPWRLSHHIKVEFSPNLNPHEKNPDRVSNSCLPIFLDNKTVVNFIFNLDQHLYLQVE